MKKSKVILAIALAVILLVTIMNAPTFSWFTRPQPAYDKLNTSDQSGEYLALTTKNSYTAYNGYNCKIATYASDDGVTYSTTATTSYNGSDINSHFRKYFRTTITNNSSTAQNVSLYAKTLSMDNANNGTLALGVNTPTRSYRDYTALAQPSAKIDRNWMRVYFEKDNNVEGWSGTSFYIVWSETTLNSNGLGTGNNYTKLEHVGGSNNPNQYYADIPSTAKQAFFCVENFGTNNNNSPNWGQRSQNVDLAQQGQTKTASKLFKITSTTSYNNHVVVTYSVTGNNIYKQYSLISVPVGSTFSAVLANNEYITDNNTQTAISLEYYSSNTSIFTVDPSSGLITPVAAGEAVLYTKSVGGSYPDTQQVETTVRVSAARKYAFYDVPIVKNILIPAAGEVNVDWYVINNSDTTKLSYEIDQIYLGM
ncbi:MAG: hypothetical protein IJ639_08410 [Ruminococcus sp.]|nr:hypothetical protein [Ruminococcus sp.]